MRSQRVVFVVALVAVLAAGFLLQENVFWLRVLTFALLLSAVAQSWNLLAGYAGQWSLAQLAFFGLGAYVAGILEQRWQIPLLLGLLIAVPAVALFAAGIGYVTLRIRGHYFALVTFLLTVSLFELVRYFADYTGGQYGLSITFQPGTNIWMLQFDNQVAYYYLALVVSAIATGTLWLVARSRLGLLLRAIRDDEDSAAALGTRVLALKVAAMAISAAMAAVAGVAYLGTYKLMDAETAFGIHNSLDPVVAGILGGAGTLLGGVVGEFVLQPMVAQVNVQFGSLPGIAALLYGVVLMLAILLIPQGLLRVVRPGGLRRYGASLRSRFHRDPEAVMTTHGGVAAAPETAKEPAP